MQDRRCILMTAVFAIGLAALPAMSNARPALGATAVVKVRKAVVFHHARMRHPRRDVMAIAQADAGRAVQLKSGPVSTGPQLGLATGTARYDLGPTGLEDDVSTIGIVTKF